MAGSNDLPSFREKRKTLFGEKTREEEMRQTGTQFMEAGQYDDALEFFARCDAAGKVREILERAKQEGNTPLYLRAKVVLGEAAEEDELRELARAAHDAGRPSMALVAYEKAGMEERAEELRQELLAGDEPIAVPGKEPAEVTDEGPTDEPAQ
jgi:hypothetical protein